jgi:hypothetical protein
MGILKVDYVRLLTTTKKQERLSAERAMGNCNGDLSATDRNIAMGVACEDVVDMDLKAPTAPSQVARVGTVVLHTVDSVATQDGLTHN